MFNTETHNVDNKWNLVCTQRREAVNKDWTGIHSNHEKKYHDSIAQRCLCFKYDIFNKYYGGGDVFVGEVWKTPCTNVSMWYWSPWSHHCLYRRRNQTSTNDCLKLKCCFKFNGTIYLPGKVVYMYTLNTGFRDGKWRVCVCLPCTMLNKEMKFALLYIQIKNVIIESWLKNWLNFESK